MKQSVAIRRGAFARSNSNSSQVARAPHPFAVVSLVWMGITVCSLIFMYTFEFGFTWMAPWLLVAGIAATLGVLREGQRQSVNTTAVRVEYSAASRCIWKLDSEG